MTVWRAPGPGPVRRRQGSRDRRSEAPAPTSWVSPRRRDTRGRPERRSSGTSHPPLPGSDPRDTSRGAGGTSPLTRRRTSRTHPLDPRPLEPPISSRRRLPRPEPATDVAPVTAESAETTERRTMPTDLITNQWMSDTSRLRISHNEACIATSIGIMIHETATGSMT